jgi:hypothetical protein
MASRKWLVGTLALCLLFGVLVLWVTFENSTNSARTNANTGQRAHEPTELISGIGESETTSTAESDPIQKEDAPDSDRENQLASERELSIMIEEFRKSYDSYIQYLIAEKDAPHHALWYDIWDSGTERVDSRLEALIVTAAEEEKSFEAVRERLAGAVEWIALPEEVEVRLGLEKGSQPTALGPKLYHSLPDAPRPVVLYKTAAIEPEGSLSVLHHAHWCASGKSFLYIRRVKPYSLRISPDGVDVQDFMRSEDSYFRASTELQYVAVDLVDMDTGLPWVIMAQGPVGNGRYVRLGYLHFCKDKEVWNSVGGDEWEKANGWTYNAENREFVVEFGVDVETVSLSEELPKAREFWAKLNK